MNFNNSVTKYNVLIDNLANLSDKYEDTLVLTGWLVESPFIWPYLNQELLEKVEWSKLKDCFDPKFGFYEVLKKIGTKDGRIPFLYARDTFEGTYTYLFVNGFDLQKLDVAEVNQELIDELKEYFTKYVTKTSVEGFIDKLKKAKKGPFSEENNDTETTIEA